MSLREAAERVEKGEYRTFELVKIDSQDNIVLYFTNVSQELDHELKGAVVDHIDILVDSVDGKDVSGDMSEGKAEYIKILSEHVEDNR
jgi:hypothetical protein